MKEFMIPGLDDRMPTPIVEPTRSTNTARRSSFWSLGMQVMPDTDMYLVAEYIGISFFLESRILEKGVVTTNARVQ
jgi:hypothetical protein